VARRAAVLRAGDTPHVLIKPNPVSHRHQLPATHAETRDAVLVSGARHVTVAEASCHVSLGLRNCHRDSASANQHPTPSTEAAGMDAKGRGVGFLVVGTG